MADNLLIVGASARAAAFSALRAGLQPWCADLFADADLAARCRVIRISPEDYPDRFEEIAAWEPPGPWLYTGGLENRPRLVRKISKRRLLWGNSEGRIGPEVLCRALDQAGMPCPRVRLLRPPDQGDVLSWLIKPLGGAGGVGIRLWNHDSIPADQLRWVYFQEFIPGESCAALFLGQHPDVRLLGLTTQLVGAEWLHASRFYDCGSFYRPLPDGVFKAQFERLGRRLVADFAYRGLFGVDCILRDGVPYPVEVNPRYTASVEVLEYASGIPLLAQHRAVFEPTSQRLAFRARPALSELVGKAILFAKDDLTFPNDGPWMSTLRTPSDIWDLPAFADIPHPGEPIEKGKPILTFFARGPTEAAVLATLQATAADLERWLFKS